MKKLFIDLKKEIYQLWENNLELSNFTKLPKDLIIGVRPENITENGSKKGSNYQSISSKVDMPVDKIIGLPNSAIFKREGIYTFLNPYSYLHARKNIELYRQFDGVYADGQWLVYFLRLFNIKKTITIFVMVFSLLGLILFNLTRSNSIYKCIPLGSKFMNFKNACLFNLLSLVPNACRIKDY